MVSAKPGNAATVSAGTAGAWDDTAFRWDEAQTELTGAPDGSLNIGSICADRQVALGRGGNVAVRWLGRRLERRDVTYGELAEQSGRFARVLADLGLQPGETVAVLLGRVPELFSAALGIWKAGGVYCPLFAAFGPGPIKARLELGKAAILVTSDELYARKVAASRSGLPQLRQVLLVGESGSAGDGCAVLRDLLDAAQPMAAAATAPEAPAFLHFTSGTTGTPKGVLHPHRAVLAHLVTGRKVFGLSESDVFWCTADPGWVTSTSYGIIAPLTCGATLIADEAELDPRRWYGILHDEKVTAWYTTPTAIRTMMRYGAALARSYRENALRVAASVGEPLNAEAVMWGQKALGVPFLDTWWQTETGAITIANGPGTGRRPGSMGRPLPGVDVSIMRCEGGAAKPVDGAEAVGELAIRTCWPSMFSGALGEETRYGDSFREGWYFTGDLVKRDKDGFIWFVGRADDMIKCGGLQIGPFEVESSLMDHPAVAEIGVVGKPDMLVREVPVAFISVNPGFEAGDALRAELLSYARQELGASMAPREIHFVEELPKTNSGKIMRRVLKAKAVGEPDSGDILNTLPPCPGRYDDE
ncbi:Acetyl-coenzyme A synthetase [Paramagnetospirillum magnetotacticum MS-1]|uniref:acetate--CoA ligase n=1 Tax=Paramagnetospirillum magnetotacticum MS-1 TaxID=272627 RepID=A0A0C2V4I3_PARME|nr:AMP-binding protein [Paramagnetospirillum magnetotacticum]KIL99991.1 Acetyl-coenzyme A synthetase [Paramagnetospirillum magnetotacticum MS-1]